MSTCKHEYESLGLAEYSDPPTVIHYRHVCRKCGRINVNTVLRMLLSLDEAIKQISRKAAVRVVDDLLISQSRN